MYDHIFLQNTDRKIIKKSLKENPWKGGPEDGGST
jgi:hypothetical protein